MADKNRRWVYARPPAGEVTTDIFELSEETLPELREGEVLVRTTMLSIDPASRAWMAGVTYRSQLMPGDTMAGWGLGEVVKSNATRFRARRSRFRRIWLADACVMSGKALTKHDSKAQARTSSERARHYWPHRLFRNAGCGAPATR